MDSMGRYASGLLIVLTGAFLVGALAVAFRIVTGGLLSSEMPIAALLATVAGVFLTAQRQISDRQESTSKFYLERMKWFAAARVLATARRLCDCITVDAHRSVAKMGMILMKEASTDSRINIATARCT